MSRNRYGAWAPSSRPDLACQLFSLPQNGAKGLGAHHRELGGLR
jgi:hypothetical protein